MSETTKAKERRLKEGFFEKYIDNKLLLSSILVSTSNIESVNPFHALHSMQIGVILCII